MVWVIWEPRDGGGKNPCKQHGIASSARRCNRRINRMTRDRLRGIRLRKLQERGGALGRMTQEKFGATEFQHGKCADARIKSRISKRSAKQRRAGRATITTTARRQRARYTHHGVIHAARMLRDPRQRCRTHGGAARGRSGRNGVEPSAPRRCRAGRTRRCSAGGIRCRGTREPKVEVTQQEARVIVKCSAISRAERVERAATTTGVCRGVLCKCSDGKNAEHRFYSGVGSKGCQHGVCFGVATNTR
jgi:hypothetical protein